MKRRGPIVIPSLRILIRIPQLVPKLREVYIKTMSCYNYNWALSRSRVKIIYKTTRWPRTLSRKRLCPACSKSNVWPVKKIDPYTIRESTRRRTQTSSQARNSSTDWRKHFSLAALQRVLSSSMTSLRSTCSLISSKMETSKISLCSLKTWCLIRRYKESLALSISLNRWCSTTTITPTTTSRTKESRHYSSEAVNKNRSCLSKISLNPRSKQLPTWSIIRWLIKSLTSSTSS